jgi:F1F0 ATPase subunit 2
MNDWTTIALSGLSGLLLGILFFGGLWWTVRRGLTSRGAAAWFMVSLLVRTVLVVAGFYVVTRGELFRLIVCLLGFLVARQFITARHSAVS